MAKIDRLGWADGLAFTAYGLRIGVRANKAEALAALVPRLPPGWQAAARPEVDFLYSVIQGGSARPGARNYHLTYAGPIRIVRTLDLDEMHDLFENHLQLFVAEFARRRVFLHAGVVGWQGRALVFPGRSFSGKSTLVAELVRRGASYYSDEYAVLDTQGRVHPYPRRLSLRRQPGNSALRQTAEELGGTTGVKPLPVGLVLLTQHRPGVRWRPRRLSPGRGLLEMLQSTIPTRRKPEATLIAQKHYLQVTDADFRRAAKTDSAPTAQNTAQHVARTERKKPENTGFSANSPGFSDGDNYALEAGSSRD